MTLEQFAEEFKELLRRTREAGLDLDEVCGLAEAILEGEWS